MVMCDLWIGNVKNQFISDLFSSIKEGILSDVNFEFKQNGFLDKERVLEFKSASDFRSSPSEFVNKFLLPTTRKYFNNGKPTRYCILYGVEDNLRIIPLTHLKNDDATQIENLANEISFKEGYTVNVYPIPTQGKAD